MFIFASAMFLSSRTLSSDRRGTELAAPRLQRNLTQAFRTLSSRRIRRFLHPGQEMVDGQYNQEVHSCRGNNESQQHIYEITVHEFAVMDRKAECREIGCSDDR